MHQIETEECVNLCANMVSKFEHPRTFQALHFNVIQHSGPDYACPMMWSNAETHVPSRCICCFRSIFIPILDHRCMLVAFVQAACALSIALKARMSFAFCHSRHLAERGPHPHVSLMIGDCNQGRCLFDRRWRLRWRRRH